MHVCDQPNHSCSSADSAPNPALFFKPSMFPHINLDSLHNHGGKANYPLKQTACTAENPKFFALSQPGVHQSTRMVLELPHMTRKAPKPRSTLGKPFFHVRFKKCFSKPLLSCLFTWHKSSCGSLGTHSPERRVNEELVNETQFLLVNPRSISTLSCTTQSCSVRSETGNSTLPSWEMTNNLGFEAHFGLLRSHQFEALL